MIDLADPVRRVGWLGVALTLAGCGELEPPAVTVGDRAFTVSDLRAEWATWPVGDRAPLGTREERLAFANEFIDRLYLLDEGERRLAAQAAPDPLGFARLESEILVRRLRTLEGGRVAIDSTALEEALARSRMTYRVEWASYASQEAAIAAASRIAEGGTLEDERRRSDVGGSVEEFVLRWSPFPDPIADLAATLEPGKIGGPVLMGTEWLLLRLNERGTADGDDAASSTIARGLRAREQVRANSALIQRLWAEADVEIRDDAVSRLAARTSEAILAPDAVEGDSTWAVPSLAAGEDTVAVATRGGDVVLSMRDYVQAVERRGTGQRPRGGALRRQIRDLVEEEINVSLMREEALRRHLDDEWFVRRTVGRLREDRRLQFAVQAIQAEIRPAASTVDSLVQFLRTSSPGLFERPARARVLRFDLRGRGEANQELRNIRNAGSGPARLAEILEGRGAPLAGTYHLVHVNAAGIGGGELERELSSRGPGAVVGPVELGQLWSVAVLLDREPPRDLGPEVARQRVLESFGADPGALRRWLAARRSERPPVVDEAALDALGPTG
ncbi:MAG: hypothetical protein R3B81_08075 [bacterium]